MNVAHNQTQLKARDVACLELNHSSTMCGGTLLLQVIQNPQNVTYSCGVPIRSQRFRHVYRCLSEVAKFCLLRSHAMKPKANRRRLIETDKLQEEKFERKVTLIEKCDNLMMKWLFYSTVFRDCEIASHPSSISISIPFPSCVMLVTHRSCSGVWCVANLPCPFAMSFS